MAPRAAGRSANDLPGSGYGQSADFAERRRQLDPLVLHFESERVVITPLLPRVEQWCGTDELARAHTLLIAHHRVVHPSRTVAVGQVHQAEGSAVGPFGVAPDVVVQARQVAHTSAV